MAEASLRKLQTLTDEGRYLEIKHESTETLGHFADRYFDWRKGVGQKDCRSKKQRLGVIAQDFGKETLLARITRTDVERFQAGRLGSVSHRGTPMKPATVNREMALLKHLLAKAVE